MLESVFKFCFISVNKKTDSKFFEIENGNIKNPREGTVIDTTIVNPDIYEFFMQPQFVNQGTANPSHFIVLYDTTGIPLETLEELTYAMCFYYWGWNGAIRLPAVLKFAEKANKFSKEYLDGYAHEKLRNTTFYI